VDAHSTTGMPRSKSVALEGRLVPSTTSVCNPLRRIERVKREDRGDYICSADNKVGKAASKEISLEVRLFTDLYPKNLQNCKRKISVVTLLRSSSTLCLVLVVCYCCVPFKGGRSEDFTLVVFNLGRMFHN
jgi:hypothetical protein